MTAGGKSNHWQPEDHASGATTQEAEGVNLQATDPRMIEALEGATSPQLYQLKALIEAMLTEPRRGITARASLPAAAAPGRRASTIGLGVQQAAPAAARHPSAAPRARLGAAPALQTGS